MTGGTIGNAVPDAGLKPTPDMSRHEQAPLK
eukprot:CAMPEP_0179214788 /NCGR_PEP_ID=MMETSP0797-20121207/2515_1 /TAXON_ID=47934 /ORGANISM="Dinophysis acuminata, Strain DAEP01" /LENGTH=30 /DNA_ID= /DNA_START= /DNA_END= /DNA_ORIENTATION=